MARRKSFSFWQWLLEGDPPPRRPARRQPRPKKAPLSAFIGPATAKSKRQRHRKTPSIRTSRGDVVSRIATGKVSPAELRDLMASGHLRIRQK